MMMTDKVYLNEEVENKVRAFLPKKAKQNKKGKPVIRKIAFYLILIAGIFAITNYALERYIAWRSEYGLRKPIVFNYELYKQSIVYKLPEQQINSPVVIEQIEQPLEVGSPIEQKILELWGDRYFLIARSIFKCESGLRVDAVNWSTRDIGVTQINFPTWETRIKEKFGYTLVDLFDANKNLEVAYWIWDRADGEEGNGQGSFEPWVAFTNGNFVGCVE